MYEKALREDSAWANYIHLLPERECLPLVWSLDKVDSLLCGTKLREVVKEDKACLYDGWKEHIQPLILSEAFKFDPSYFGVEQYFSAKSLVSSRSFAIDDYHGYGMVPLADRFNHKTGAENIQFTTHGSSSSSDSDDHGDNSGISHDDKSVIETHSSSSSGDNPDTLEMIVVRDVQAGAEVFNTYGIMGSAALFHRYGFIEQDNTFDIVNMDLDLVLKWSSSLFSNHYSRSRFSLWRKLNYSGCTSENGEPQIKLVILLFIIFLPKDAYHKLSLMTHSFCQEANESANFMKLININRSKCIDIAEDRMKELLRIGDVCTALVSLADVRESFYGSNSLEDDENQLRNYCCIKERKLNHTLVLHVSERSILSKLRVYTKGWPWYCCCWELIMLEL